jgi:uncharacterized protein (TIGR02145 family)
MNKSYNVLFSIFIALFIFIVNVNKCMTQVTDIDGNTYKTVTIGTQVWMAENLNVEHYSNGDPIPQVQDKDEWSKLTTGAWCYYENKTSNGKTYGKLYNGFAVYDPRGLAPEGWHIPSDSEWTQLTDFLGGKEVAGGKLKATILWNDPNEGATNSSGFTAFPGGFRDYYGYFGSIGEYGFFWSSSEYVIDLVFVWSRNLNHYDSEVFRYYGEMARGISVRCVKD